MKGEHINSYIFPNEKHEMKYNQTCPGFELVSLIPFATTITVALSRYVNTYTFFKNKDHSTNLCRTSKILKTCFRKTVTIFYFHSSLPQIFYHINNF